MPRSRSAEASQPSRLTTQVGSNRDSIEASRHIPKDGFRATGTACVDDVDDRDHRSAPSHCRSSLRAGARIAPAEDFLLAGEIESTSR